MHSVEQDIRTYNTTRISFWDSLYQKSMKTLGGYYRKRLNSIYQNIIPKGSSVLELGCGTGDILAAVEPAHGVGIDFSIEAISKARSKYPHLEFFQFDVHEFNIRKTEFDYIILSELVNDIWDVQSVLDHIHNYCGAHTRIIINFYSHLWNIPISIAQMTGVASPKLPQNWLTRQDMLNLLKISGFQVIRLWEEIIAPLRIPLFSDFANRYLAKISPFRHLDMANFVVARSIKNATQTEPSVSVIVAARNESGHIDELLLRIPEMGSHTEIIFVEGNSTDDTYAAIEKAIAANTHRDCKLYKQPGKGKGDAVRTGFEKAEGDILMILDADITVPPEDLPRFYGLLAKGYCEFVNGVRLVYPMQDDAMRFANLLGNKFFSWAFTWLLGQPLRDTLCGTKVLWRDDYKKIARNRSYFGDFDPFGDFDLLFGAAKLNLKIMEVPVRYRARRYGETNISRWSHGWLLLKMVAFAAKRIKFI